jgi:hypothetical protein
MQGENPAKRFVRFRFVTIAVLVGAFVTMLLATPAGAFHSKNPSRNDQWDNAFDRGDVYQGFDPMETSIPYVAWRGEEIRLVKCFDEEYFQPRENGDPREGGLTDAQLSLLALEANETGEWQIMDWSGDAHVWPKFFDDNDQQTQVFWPSRGEQRGRGCFAIDITSHKPGIAIVKLKVDDEGSGDGVGEGVKGEGDPVATHQFVVIWMAFQDVRLRDLDADNPLGPVTENPGDTNNLGVVVQGRIPLNEEFRTELGLSAAIQARGALVFPEDYPALARTPLAHVSWPLQKANNGIEGDDNYNNPSCDDNPLTGAPTGIAANNDSGDLDDPDPNACDSDVGDEEEGLDLAYVPEPRHSPGDFWDIHDSTGPYNTNVYDSATVNDKPDIADICPGPETADHNEDCHVDQFADEGLQEPDTYVSGGGDESCDDGEPDGAGGPNGNDTVDNCDRGQWDAFSRVFHDVAGEDDEDNDPVIGPYSPTRPDETMLSDSVVNAHDAPMPAALVVVSIAPNQGNGDIGGVGSLVADVDKHEVYNRGGADCTPPTGDPENEHCVTGPYSGAYIPPSPTMENNPAQNVPDAGGDLDDDSDTASGIHGAIANNFNGYLPVYYPERGDNAGLYHYWDLVDTLRVAVPSDTDCPDPNNGVRQTPSGPQEIALYTDEHGEARLTFDAGTGFFFDEFIRPNDPQAGCLPVGLLGTAEITVNARYPFQPTTSAGAVSNRLVKNIESLFRKGIICVPKRFEEDDKVLCVVFGRDIDGSPIIGEEVCVTAIGDSGTLVRTFIPSHETSRPGSNTACGRLHANRDEKEDLATDEFPTIDDTFGIETFLIIGQGSVRIIADFREERLEFGTTVQIPPAAGTTGASIGQVLTSNQQVTPAPRPVPGPAGVAVIPTGNTQNSGTVTNPGNRPQLNTPVLKARTSLVFVRIVKPLKLGGNRYVVLRVKSSQKSSRVQIKLIGKRGKVLGTIVRKVKTNRTIRVPNLRLPKAVVTVRAKVLA